MMRRYVRLLGTLMIIAGAGTLAWAVVVWRWQDPFTYIYTHYEQHRLAAQYEKRLAHYRPVVLPAHVSLAAERRSIAREATRYRRETKRGEALGRMKIPRLGLNSLYRKRRTG